MMRDPAALTPLCTKLALLVPETTVVAFKIGRANVEASERRVVWRAYFFVWATNAASAAFISSGVMSFTCVAIVHFWP
jgi:hypothetical protein